MRSLAIVVCMLSFTAPAWTAEKAGQVIFVAGSVAVERGESFKLKKSDPIYEGDIIVTAAKSRGQLLMKDGAKFSLKAKTRFAVEEYFLEGDEREQDNGAVIVASNNGAVTNLIKGGFRTISGAIGKVDPEEYVVKSPAATMGIRGTHYSAVWCAGDCALAASASGEEIPDGLYVGVTDGVIAISNLSGEYTIGAGEYYYVQDFDSTPVRLPKPPSILGDSTDAEEATEEDESEEAEEESSDEESEEAADESSEDSEESGEESSDESTESSESSDESAESSDSSDETTASSDDSSAAADESSAQQAEAAAEIADTAAAIGDSAESVGLGSTGSGSETESAGFTARSTTPPDTDPGESGGESSEGSSETPAEESEEESSEESSAGSSEGSGDSDGTVASTDESSSGSTGSGTGSSGSSGGSTGSTGGGFGDSSGFDGGFGDSGGIGGGSTTGTSSEPPVPITTESGETIESGDLPGGRAVAHGSGPISGLSATVFTGSSDLGERTLSGNDLTTFQAPPTSNDSTYAIGNSSTRDDGFHAATGIGWGRWTGGNSTVTEANGTVINLDLSEQSLHWVYGPQAAPVIPTTGTAIYSLIVGNTDPTDTIGNSGFLGSASLQANFTNATVQSDVSLAIAGNVWEASGTGSLSNSLFNGVYNSLLIDGQSGGGGNFSGFFGSAGSNGLPNGAGLTYGLTSPQGISVSGAVIFGQPAP